MLRRSTQLIVQLALAALAVTPARAQAPRADDGIHILVEVGGGNLAFAAEGGGKAFPVSQVATAQPYTGDSAEELAAWVANGISSSAATVAGDGAAAVIRVDLTRGEALVRGPDLDPMLDDIQSARMRYRWIDHLTSEQLSLTLYLAAPDPDKLIATVPLSPAGVFAPVSAGAWVDYPVTSNYPPPPFRARTLVVRVEGYSYDGQHVKGHGFLEIDRIALVR